MKALSLARPWPHAILHMVNRFVHRAERHMCDYRGPLLLHANEGWDDDASLWMRERGALLPRRDHHPAGGIVGRCKVVGHVEPIALWDGGAQPRIAGNVDNFTCEHMRWWMGGHALILAEVEALPFVPVPRQGLELWNVPADVLAAIDKGEGR